jgi:hypothetical protein
MPTIAVIDAIPITISDGPFERHADSLRSFPDEFDQDRGSALTDQNRPPAWFATRGEATCIGC